MMPYIKKERRIDFDQRIRELVPLLRTSGELNYVITKIIHEMIKTYHGPSYDMLNSMIGVLECAKLELYRKIAAPYEDKKQTENGPVSELDK